MGTTEIYVFPILQISLLGACATPVSEGEVVAPEPTGTEEGGVTPDLPLSEPGTKKPTELLEVNTGTPLKEMESGMTELTITTGTYFGECLGICADILAITSEKMRFENFATPVDYQRPENVDIRETLPSEWDRIAANIDVDTFSKLPDQIGYPDASDMGGEFVEIVNSDYYKRLDFDFGAMIPEIDDLLEVLRELRIEFSNKYR